MGSHHCSVRSRAWLSVLKHFHCVRALGPGCPVTATRCPGTDLLPASFPKLALLEVSLHRVGPLALSGEGRKELEGKFHEGWGTR